MCTRILHSMNPHPTPPLPNGCNGGTWKSFARNEEKPGMGGERSFYNKGDEKFLKSLFKVSKIAATLFFIRSK